MNRPTNKQLKALDKELCSICGLPISCFRTTEARKTFEMLGTCQLCQDEGYGGRR